MNKRSEHHHEVPVWFLANFSPDGGKRIWIGTKEKDSVRMVGIKDTFVRRDANTQTNFRDSGSGTLQPIRSDTDEKILAEFDRRASLAIRALIDFLCRKDFLYKAPIRVGT